MWPFTSSFKRIVEDKCAQRNAAIANAGAYAIEHQEYLNATATQIVQRIEKGEWTASGVLEAYMARAVQAHSKTNCLTEILFEQARKDAKLLDKEFSETGRLKGPLHGVPVSLKDQYDVSGVDTTIGFTQWANNPAAADASIVKQLRAAGAIPLAKTNVPQTMLAFECSNPLWGRTTNPWSDAHTCGGSSGGEAALLAMDGSALGVGSDIGGSLRIPASYCGVYALKPGFGRIAYTGSRGANQGFEGVRVVSGPMSRSVEDIELISRLVFGVQDDNYYPAPIPYRDVALPAKLHFGYYTSDRFVKASPVCKRAVLETVEALRLAGHMCTEFELPEAPRPLELFAGLTSADGYETLISPLGPDPKESSLFLVTLGPSMPGFVRRLASWAITTFIGDSIFGKLMLHSRKKTVAEYYKYTDLKNRYTRNWNQEVWGKYGFDGIIAPVQAVPALPHGGCDKLSPLAIATIQYNVVDSPVGVIPVTRVDPTLDQLTDEWRTASDHGSKLLEAELYGKNPVYKPEVMKGLPVGVQVVGRKWEEEKVIAMMHVVDKVLEKKRTGFGPGSWTPSAV